MKTFCIVMHSNNTGYVIRTKYDNYLPAPYTNAVVLYEYKTKSGAQKKANLMNNIFNYNETVRSIKESFNI